MSGIFDQIINYSPPLIVSGTVNYKGTWNASTNNPTLNNPPAASTKGDYYVVSTAGTQFSISFVTGDWIISSGTAWEKVDLTDAVSSVFGRTGAVVGVSTDYSAVGITNTAIGAANPSTGAFTTVSATTPIAVASGGTGVSTSTGTTAVVLSNSPTIVTPVIAQINDANGNATLRLTGITSATDYLEIKNGIGVGSPLHVLAEGASTNIGVHLQPKGSGLFTISDGTDFNKGIRFRSSSSAASAVTLIDAVSTAGRVVTLPDATGTLLYGGGPLGTPSSGTVTNLTGTASININGTVGATTPSTVAATTLTTLATNGVNIFESAGVSSVGLQFRTNGSNRFKIETPSASSDLVFYSGGTTEVARFSSTGLEVTGTGRFTGAVLTIGTGYSGAGAVDVGFDGNARNGSSFTDSTDTSGAIFASFRKASGVAIGSISRVTTTDAVVLNTTSDGRLKENLRDFTDSGRLIDSLKPRVFDWKNSDENGKNVIGFIAQEQHAADPIFAHIGAVSVGDEDPKTITKQWQRSDSALIPILVAELQSVRQRLAALESN